jgi:hypothetical protein
MERQNLGVLGIPQLLGMNGYLHYHDMFLISDVASWSFFLKDLKLLGPPLLVQ